MIKIRPLPPGKVGKTVIDNLAPTIARVRQIATELGIRPYRVFIFRVTWSGVRIGEGSVSANPGWPIELLPTPKVLGFDASRRPVDVGGTHEIADLRVKYIPFRHGQIGYTEDDLVGAALTNPLADNEQVYYEVRGDGGEDKGTRLTPFPRRFKLIGIPELRKGSLSWFLSLKKVEQDFIGPVDP